MKKMLCLLLTLLLAFSTATAFAVEYTLPEKLQRQIESGSGLKGTLSVTVEGTGEWVKLLSLMNGQELQIRAIRADDSFQYQLYSLSGEEQVGITQLYGDSQTVYLRSTLLPDILLKMVTGGDVINRLAGTDEGENPSWYSAAINLLSIPATTWESKWLPLLSTYESAMEMWLSEFASTPVVSREENSLSTMTVRYDIPMEAVKAEIKELLPLILQDEELMTLLGAQVTEQQRLTYLNPDFMYYYEQVIDAMEIDGTVILERELSTQGEIIRTTLSFPFPHSDAGWEDVVIEQASGATSVTLTGEKQVIVLRMEEVLTVGDTVAYRGGLRVIPNTDDGQAVSVAFAATKIHTQTTDEDTRSHDVTTWDISLSSDLSHLEEDDPARDSYLTFDPIQLALTIHLHSKAANNNATTLAVAMKAQLPDGTANVEMELKTTSPWVLEALPTDGAQDIADMEPEELTEALTDIILNGLVTLAATREDEPEEATLTDLPALEMSEPAPSVVPAVTQPADDTDTPAA